MKMPLVVSRVRAGIGVDIPVGTGHAKDSMVVGKEASVFGDKDMRQHCLGGQEPDYKGGLVSKFGFYWK